MELLFALSCVALVVVAGWYLTHVERRFSAQPADEALGAIPALRKHKGTITAYEGDAGRGLLRLSDGETLAFSAAQWRDDMHTPAEGMDVDMYEHKGQTLLYARGNAPQEIVEGVSVAAKMERVIERFVKEGCTSITRGAYMIAIACANAPASYTLIYRGGEVIVRNADNEIVDISDAPDEPREKVDFYLRLWNN